MDGMTALLLIVMSLMIFAVLAMHFGADSRASIGDDHAR